MNVSLILNLKSRTGGWTVLGRGRMERLEWNRVEGGHVRQGR